MLVPEKIMLVPEMIISSGSLLLHNAGDYFRNLLEPKDEKAMSVRAEHMDCASIIIIVEQTDQTMESW